MYMSQLKQWPRKIECTLCVEPHMVDARGFKQHQNKVRTEREAMSTTDVPNGVSVETFQYRLGWVDGYRAALDQTGKKAA